MSDQDDYHSKNNSLRLLYYITVENLKYLEWNRGDVAWESVHRKASSSAAVIRAVVIAGRRTVHWNMTARTWSGNHGQTPAVNFSMAQITAVRSTSKPDLYRIVAKSPCRPSPSLKRPAPVTPSAINASRPLYHS